MQYTGCWVFLPLSIYIHTCSTLAVEFSSPYLHIHTCSTLAVECSSPYLYIHTCSTLAVDFSSPNLYKQLYCLRTMLALMSFTSLKHSNHCLFRYSWWHWFYAEVDAGLTFSNMTSKKSFHHFLQIQIHPDFSLIDFTHQLKTATSKFKSNQIRQNLVTIIQMNRMNDELKCKLLRDQDHTGHVAGLAFDWWVSRQVECCCLPIHQLYSDMLMHK